MKSSQNYDIFPTVQKARYFLAYIQETIHFRHGVKFSSDAICDIHVFFVILRLSMRNSLLHIVSLFRAWALAGIYFLLIAAVSAPGALLCSCSSGADPVQALISKAAADPEARNENTFNELTALILASPDKYRNFFASDGTLDLDKLQAAISKAAERAGTKGDWDITSYGGALKGDLRLRLMLERSGSMTGYDARSGSGDFKRAVSELVTRFPHAGTGAGSILIVNDDLYPYPGTFESFVQDKDIFSSTASIGNPAYTDFAGIFTKSLTDTVPEQVTVLVSDLIYSPKNTEGTGAEKIFNEESALASSLFKSHLDKSMIIVRLSSDFKGTYYPFGSNVAFSYSGRRPYYMIITGSAAALSRLRSSEKYASFIDFRSLPGFEAEYFFNRRPIPLTWWSVMPRKNSSEGAYTLAGGSAEQGSHALKDATPAQDGMLTFTVAADLSDIPADPAYLIDPANYEIDSDAPARILSIKAVAPSMADARNKRYLKHATHLFTISVNGRVLPESLTVKLLNRLPSWIKEGSSVSDTNPHSLSFSKTTFGLLPFMQGVYNAYYGTAEVPAFTSFTVKFEK